LKHLIILIVLLMPLTAVDSWSIYQSNIEAKKIVKDGVEYLALDTLNAKIMMARFQVLWQYEKDYKQLSAENLFLEIQLKEYKANHQLKDKIKNYAILGLIVIVVLESGIIYFYSQQ